MNLSTEGLIIKEQNTGENTRLVTVLSKECGLIRAFVKTPGVSKAAKAPLPGCCVTPG